MGQSNQIHPQPTTSNTNNNRQTICINHTNDMNRINQLIQNMQIKRIGNINRSGEGNQSNPLH